MVTASAGPQEIVANVYLGEHLHDEQDGIYQAPGMRAIRESRPTKEYPRVKRCTRSCSTTRLRPPGGTGERLIA